MSLTPSVSSNPMLGPGSNPTVPPSSARRQTIGFARFKTRNDALAAKDHLQGKKIDSLTGSVLKAEMAKKNLHTKKTTSSEEIMGFLLRSGRLGLVPGMGSATGPVSVGGPSGGTGAMGSVRDAWESWPNSSSGPGSDKDARLNIDEKTTANASSQPNMITNPTSSSASTSTSTLAPAVPTPTSPSLRQTDSKALLALAEEADELEGWSVNGALGMGMTMGPPYEGYSSVSAPGQGQGPALGQGQSQRRLGSQPGPSGSAYGRHRHGHGSEYGTNATGTILAGEHVDGAPVGGIGLSGGRIIGANPADQNPPVSRSIRVTPLKTLADVVLAYRSTPSMLVTFPQSRRLLTRQASSKNLSERYSVVALVSNECHTGKRSMAQCALLSLKRCRTLVKRSKNCMGIIL